jgi:hypothetical protein
MNEFIFVEFIFEIEPGMSYLESKLGKDFVFIDNCTLIDHKGNLSYKISGKINSEAATVIKLRDKFLSDRMRISYIPDTLKDRYRV